MGLGSFFEKLLFRIFADVPFLPKPLRIHFNLADAAPRLPGVFT